MSDFKHEKVPAKNRKGYRIVRVYKGAYLRWNLDQPSFNRRRLTALAGAVCSAAFYIFGVSRDSIINHLSLSGVPGALCLLPLVFCVWGTVQLFTAGNRMPAALFVSRRRYLIAGGLMTSLMGLVAFILSCVVCIRLNGLTEGIDWFCAALYLLCGLAAFPAARSFYKVELVRENAGSSVSAG